MVTILVQAAFFYQNIMSLTDLLGLQTKWSMSFCSNWGTESDPDSKYHNGNSEPRGFGKLFPNFYKITVPGNCV